MKKLQKLYQHIVEINGIHQENIRVWADHGKVFAPGFAMPNTELAFKTSYQAEITISNFGDDPNNVFASVAWWLSHYSPEHIKDESGAFVFSADIVNGQTVDLHLSVPIYEKCNFNGVDLCNCSNPVDLSDPIVTPLLFDKEGDQVTIEWDV